ncbi:hypothetical protein P5P86_00465 [Nocardioides sp. BP30]|uniref:hypothetical protein n=1 Tax=Nocardioides sp. BP30 TaxID=3036374 RepID=UPI0024699A3D|nr:hypothetical protein [Nocardioides sp. BP30]WGL52319.1 hypothetical protein P5P86_00465 [Nocardioides sp. BP30]
MIRSALHSPDRAAAVLALLVTSGTHVPLIREHLQEAPYVGWLFIALSVVAVLLAVALVVADTPAVWAMTGVVGAASVLAFLVSRTVGLPQIHDDIGNWSESLGYPAITAEAIATVAAVLTLRRAARQRAALTTRSR